MMTPNGMQDQAMLDTMNMSPMDLFDSIFWGELCPSVLIDLGYELILDE